jgi:hypothetical protein
MSNPGVLAIQDANIERCYEIVKTLPLVRSTSDPTIINNMFDDQSQLDWKWNDVKAVFPKCILASEYNITKKRYEIVNPNQTKEPNDDQYTTVNQVNKRQIYAATYGAVQKLIQDKELLEQKVIDQQSRIAELQQQMASVLAKLG